MEEIDEEIKETFVDKDPSTIPLSTVFDEVEEHQQHCAIVVQKHVRGHFVRRRQKNRQKAAKRIQHSFRQYSDKSRKKHQAQTQEHYQKLLKTHEYLETRLRLLQLEYHETQSQEQKIASEVKQKRRKGGHPTAIDQDLKAAYAEVQSLQQEHGILTKQHSQAHEKKPVKVELQNLNKEKKTQLRSLKEENQSLKKMVRLQQQALTELECHHQHELVDKITLVQKQINQAKQHLREYSIAFHQQGTQTDSKAHAQLRKLQKTHMQLKTELQRKRTQTAKNPAQNQDTDQNQLNQQLHREKKQCELAIARLLDKQKHAFHMRNTRQTEHMRNTKYWVDAIDHISKNYESTELILQQLRQVFQESVGKLKKSQTQVLPHLPRIEKKIATNSRKKQLQTAYIRSSPRHKLPSGSPRIPASITPRKNMNQIPSPRKPPSRPVPKAK